MLAIGRAIGFFYTVKKRSFSSEKIKREREYCTKILGLFDYSVCLLWWQLVRALPPKKKVVSKHCDNIGYSQKATPLSTVAYLGA
jgi:hypothetical protein